MTYPEVPWRNPMRPSRPGSCFCRRRSTSPVPSNPPQWKSLWCLPRDPLTKKESIIQMCASLDIWRHRSKYTCRWGEKVKLYIVIDKHPLSWIGHFLLAVSIWYYNIKLSINKCFNFGAFYLLRQMLCLNNVTNTCVAGDWFACIW